MDYNKVKELHEHFANDSVQMAEEFIEIFKKYYKDNPRAAIIMALHLPINLIINFIEADEDNAMPSIFPEVPDMFRRFCYPFALLKDQWGKLSNKEFCDAYTKLYESQFDEWFISDEEKKNFFEFCEGLKKDG